MALKFFVIPLRDAAAAETELNGFLRSHRVLSVDRHWVEQGDNSFWSVCVDYLESNRNEPENGNDNVGFRLARRSSAGGGRPTDRTGRLPVPGGYIARAKG